MTPERKDEPRDATDAPPAPMGERDVGDVPQTVPGALPENEGREPDRVDTSPHAEPQGRGGTTTRTRESTMRGTEGNPGGGSQAPGERELVALLNRMIMLEHESIALKEDLLADEQDTGARERIQTLIEEDRHAVDVLERTVQDLHGRVSPLRKAGGRIMGKTWFMVRDLPERARAAFERRDINAAREAPVLGRFFDYADALAAERAGLAHYELLSEIADETDLRPVKDAVNALLDTARAHADYFDGKARAVTRDTFRGITIR